jgi:hypothetical protein
MKKESFAGGKLSAEFLKKIGANPTEHRHNESKETTGKEFFQSICRTRQIRNCYGRRRKFRQ